jgi:hypothetical protein
MTFRKIPDGMQANNPRDQVFFRIVTFTTRYAFETLVVRLPFLALALRSNVDPCKTGANVALISLHWDGLTGPGRSRAGEGLPPPSWGYEQ